MIHCAATASTDPAVADAVNVRGAAAVARLAAAAGVRTLVQVSSSTAAPDSLSVYGRTKFAGEQAVRGVAGLRTVVLRPNLIVGAGGGGVYGRMAGMVRRLPVIPLLGGGRVTVQPIHAPDDHPTAMGQALKLQNETARNEQYARTIATLQNRATTVTDALQALKKISDRATEIATQADGTKTTQDLQVFAVELRQLIQQAVQLANSKDGDQYVFAGTNSGSPPFGATTDGNGNVTAVTYQGNTGVAETEIADGLAVTAAAPGENNSGAGARGVFSDGRYGADFFNHLISLQNHLAAGDSDSVATVDRPALGHDEDKLIYQTANIGVVQTQLDTAATSADNRKAALQQSLTDVAGADLTATLVQLSQTQNTYQVALQSSARLLQLQQNLLSYLP